MGQEMRQSGWQGRMGFFLHTPFPAPEVFAALPQHQRLARGLCAFDLVGFQTERDTANFRRYLTDVADGVVLDDGRIQAFDQTVRTETFSIGIDPDEIAAQADGEEGRDAAARLGKIIDYRALVIGVDRMDYSKGLPQRMEAFGRMLDDHEELRGSVSFLQIAPPSREAVDAYQVLREELDRLAGRINADYADLDWMPIRYLARSYDRGTLCGLYRQARVGLVTPLQDGMNLVAKEFVAAQTPDDPGVLVLSEFAGAAEQLQTALLVNPHVVAATADAIHRALSMPCEERIERWQELIRGVRAQDIDWWRRSFLQALEETAGDRVPA
jgi:trehalose 6-phosphate synthase